MTSNLQEGIYYAPGMRPDKFFGLLFLRVTPGATASQVGASFQRLWQVYQGLKAGTVRDLPGQMVPSGNLTVLVGYGQNVFALPAIRQGLPVDLKSGVFRSPLPTGGGPLVIGSGLRYDDDVHMNVATEDICVQFIAATALAVNRAMVETWKVLQDLSDPAVEAAPLQIVSFQTGFQRDDGRSWIDFHDGISNLPSEQRYGAIAIKEVGDPNDGWTVGGTYLSYIRLAVNLAAWRKLTRTQQELIVGRDKLTGCPLASIDTQGNLMARSGCPFAGTQQITDSGNDAFREPPGVSGPPLSLSHVQRANHHKTVITDPDSLRIFRQGYEFIEPLDMVPGFRVGLNFVSFQDTPTRLIRILSTPEWLGKTNFGGDPTQPLSGMDKFLTVRAGGVYLVPPIADNDLFPGSSLFS